MSIRMLAVIACWTVRHEMTAVVWRHCLDHERRGDDPVPLGDAVSTANVSNNDF